MTKSGEKTVKQAQWQSLVAAVASVGSKGAAVQHIEAKLDPVPRRTLQYRLKRAVELGFLRKTGKQRGVRYFVADTASLGLENVGSDDSVSDTFPFSDTAESVLVLVRKPVSHRKPVSYQPEFLNGYKPNFSRYLNPQELEHLSSLGAGSVNEPAGTFAKQLLNRLLIDLSWNSSRLEGNTYSLLETRRLIQFGAAAEGKASLEAQMILNHKDAIEFLVENAEDIGFDRYTLLNLHALLSNNLLADPSASGRLRSIDVGIGKSVYHPLALPQLIAEYFDQTLATAQAIRNPFEQALFILVQLPYLQAFDDVNKRVSRLAANIPLIKNNLLPLSFVDLQKQAYTEAVLAVYELNRIEPLKEVFIWAYERSAEYYKVIRQTLGEPDAFRLRYREELKNVVSSVVLGCMNRQAALKHVQQWVRENIPREHRAEFQEKAEEELLALHEGNIARYRIRPSQFATWQQSWVSGSKKA